MGGKWNGNLSEIPNKKNIWSQVTTTNFTYPSLQVLMKIIKPIKCIIEQWKKDGLKGVRQKNWEAKRILEMLQEGKYSQIERNREHIAGK